MRKATAAGDFQGSAFVLTDDAGQALLQPRDDLPRGVRQWVVPGGGREGGEMPLATALREICEETGLVLADHGHVGRFGPDEIPGCPRSGTYSSPSVWRTSTRRS